MLLGDLDLNANPAVRALQNVSEKIEHFEHKLKAFASSFGGFAIGYEAVMKVVEGFEGVLSMGAQMEALHISTAESVHDLVIFGHALEITGGSADMARNFIFKLQNAIAGANEDGKSTTQTLKALGTSAAELRDLPLLEQVKTLQRGIAGLGDQSAKVAALKNLFGFRFAAQALPLLANPHALEEAQQQAGPLADLLDRNAHKFHELEVAMKGVSLKKGELFGGALEVLAPDATDIADAVAKIDFIGLGHALGAALDIFLQFGKVLIWLAPHINAIFDGFGKMTAAIGALKDAGLLAGPLGALLHPAAPIHDGAPEAHHGLAEAFKGLQTPDAGGKDSPVSALQKVGLGGGFGGGSDPILSEAQRHTRLLEQLVAQGAKPAEGEPPTHPPV